MKKTIIKLSISMLLIAGTFSCKNEVSYIDYNKNGKMDVFEDVSKSIEERVDAIVSQMTLDEKVSIVTGTGMPGFDGIKPIAGYVEKGRVFGAAGTSKIIEHFGLKDITFVDGPAGVRMKVERPDTDKKYYATAFPVGTALATSWNVDLITKVGEAIGNEVLEYGADILLAPALNIHKNPLSGRNFEYYSEDPLISGKIATAYVNGVQSNNVGTSLKHYAANNQETNRFTVDEIISERAMREIYLKGFEIAVKESNPWTIMSAYNRIDGTYASERYDMLTEILRNEWKFKGFVMTDWWGGYEGFKEIRDPEAVSDVVAQISAGNDMLMPGMEQQRQELKKMVENGTLSVKNLDLSVKRILNIYFKSPTMKGYQYSFHPNLKAHAEVTRQAATEGMVLLKNNDKTLPYTNKTGIVAGFGVGTYSYVSGGTGSGDVNEAYNITLTQGLENAGYQLDKELKDLYVPFANKVMKAEKDRRAKEGILGASEKLPEMEIDANLLNKKAKENALAIITIQRNAGEQHDRKLTNDYELGKDEQQLIDKVSKAFHAQGKKVAVILNIGGAIETASWKNKVDAILLAWQSGQEGGNSIADVFSGAVNPSGKLTMTWVNKFSDIPNSKNWTGLPADNPKMIEYKEGVYVGYRYYNTFKVQPSYEFGYGLSYTTFDISDLKLSSETFNNEIIATVKVTNTGKVAGKEVVQLYLSAPAVSVDKPTSELKAFAKTKLLAPGESQEITLKLLSKDLASFVETENAWVADAGNYKVNIGVSSLKIKQQKTFELPKKIVVEKVKKAFKLNQPLTEIKK